MKIKILTILIIISGFLLRFYQLGNLPNSYSPDEVAQGYTAYSYLSTSKDEWSNSNPFVFQSFGDYKAPFQTWLMMISIKIFGLNTFSVRLPNAIFSSLAIISTALLAQLLFKNALVTLFSSLLISFSPWHLPMSRLALEANFTVFFSTLASYLLLKKPSSKLFQFLASLLFSLNLFTYHSAKFFTPFLFLATYLYVDKLNNFKKYFFYLIPFSLFLFINIFLSLSSSSRVGDISIFNPTDKWSGLSFDRYLLVLNNLPDFISRIFNNKIIYFIKSFFSNYLSYFSSQFFITSGAGETTYGMLPGFGVLGLIPTAGFIYALYQLIIKPTKDKKSIIFLLFLILISAIPAALAKGSFPANRLSSMIPFIIILSSFGLYQLLSNIQTPFKVLFIFVFLFNTFSFLTTYFFSANYRLAEGMLYGRKEAVEYLQSYPNTKVLISRSLSQPQAYYTFFAKINPLETQNNTSDWSRYHLENKSFLDQLGEYSLTNITFKNISSEDFLNYDIIIGKPEEFVSQTPTYQIFYPNSNKPSISIFNRLINEN